MVCSMFGEENIYTNQEKLAKEECCREYAHEPWEVVKFPITLFYYFAVHELFNTEDYMEGLLKTYN